MAKTSSVEKNNRRRKLVDQNRKMQAALLAATATPGTPGYEPGMDGGYFDGLNARGTFRVGRDRRSWLFAPAFSPGVAVDGAGDGARAQDRDAGQVGRIRRRCC